MPARDDLWTRLRAAGLDDEQAPTFGALWPAIVAWAEEPVVADAHPTAADEIELLWAWHEPAAQGGWTYFHPPEELGEPLFGVSITRSLAGRRELTPEQERVAVGVDLLFADEPRWLGLQGVDGYLGRAVAVPAVEHFGAAARLGDLATDEVIRLAWGAPLAGAQQRPDQLVRAWAQNSPLRAGAAGRGRRGRR